MQRVLPADILAFASASLGYFVRNWTAELPCLCFEFMGDLTTRMQNVASYEST